ETTVAGIIQSGSARTFAWASRNPACRANSTDRNRSCKYSFRRGVVVLLLRRNQCKTGANSSHGSTKPTSKPHNASLVGDRIKESESGGMRPMIHKPCRAQYRKADAGSALLQRRRQSRESKHRLLVCFLLPQRRPGLQLQ